MWPEPKHRFLGWTAKHYKATWSRGELQIQGIILSSHIVVWHFVIIEISIVGTLSRRRDILSAKWSHCNWPITLLWRHNFSTPKKKLQRITANIYIYIFLMGHEPRLPVCDPFIRHTLLPLWGLSHFGRLQRRPCSNMSYDVIGATWWYLMNQSSIILTAFNHCSGVQSMKSNHKLIPCFVCKYESCFVVSFIAAR